MTTNLPAALAAPVLAKSEAHLSNRLRVARAERDLSQEQLAQAAGVSRQTISSIETGQYCPSTLLAFRLARVLEVRVDDLFWIGGER
ncbi:MAG: helix-turn-helix transcriptional regulator [Candidatus Limnocylindria bacterium]|nr:helix-turn-helix transcriptional regulator [Candidatus Limnocylindria bacterium]